MSQKELSKDCFSQILRMRIGIAQRLCEQFTITSENTNSIFFYVLDKMIEDFAYVFQIVRKDIPQEIIVKHIFHTCVDIYCSNFILSHVNPVLNINNFPEKRTITIANHFYGNLNTNKYIIEIMKATTPAKIAEIIFRTYENIMYEEEKRNRIPLRPLPKGRPTKKESRFISLSNIELIEYYKKIIDQHQEIKTKTSIPFKNTTNIFRYNRLLTELVSELEIRGYDIDNIYKTTNTQKKIGESMKWYYFYIRQIRKNISREELYRVATFFKRIYNHEKTQKYTLTDEGKSPKYKNPFKIDRGTLDAVTIRVWHEIAPQSKVKTVNTPSSEWGVKALWKLAGIEPTTNNRYRR